MARKPNKNSTRQQAFAVLDEMIDKPRSEAVTTIMEKFSIGRSYAMTIYQHHRNNLKETGAFKKAYRVRETDNGPVVVERFVRNYGAGDASNVSAAVKMYIDDLNMRADAAKKLVDSEDESS